MNRTKLLFITCLISGSLFAQNDSPPKDDATLKAQFDVIRFETQANKNTGAREANSLSSLANSKASRVETYAATGTNTYTVDVPWLKTGYVSGTQIPIFFANANTGASTINPTTLGAKSIVTRTGGALTGGELKGYLTLVYDGTNFQIMGGNLTLATSSTAGITKLYTSTGSNTDGTMDQNSITNAIASSVAAGAFWKTGLNTTITADIDISGAHALTMGQSAAFTSFNLFSSGGIGFQGANNSIMSIGTNNMAIRNYGATGQLEVSNNGTGLMQFSALGGGDLQIRGDHGTLLFQGSSAGDNVFFTQIGGTKRGIMYSPGISGTDYLNYVTNAASLTPRDYVKNVADSVRALSVPTSRTLTINGTTYDLTANRSWTISTSTALSGLTDVNISSIADAQLLQYRSSDSKWHNFTQTGDVTINNTGVTAIGSGKVTNSMLAGSIAASKLIGTDIATVGTITSGTWNGSTIGDAYLTTSYLKADGTRALTGDWAVGTFNITGVKSFAISGTAGNGYGEFIAQSSNASAPSSSGFRIFAGSTGSFNWARKNGSDTYVRSFDATLTANRTFTLQDASSTIAMYSNDLSVFASTTSSQLAGILSNETGTNAAVFANNPALTGTVTMAPQSGATSNTTKFLMNGSTGSENLFVGANVGNTTLTSANNAGFGANVLSGLVDGNKNTSSGVGALSNSAHNDNGTAYGYQALYNFGNAVLTFGTITGGSGYTNGSYSNVTLTVQSGGTAPIFVAPLVNITVSGGAVTAVTLANNFSNGVLKTTVFTCSAASIGGTGSGFSVPVATVTNYVNTAFGYQAALSMKGGGAFNVAIGDNALNSNTVGSYNTAVGSTALYSHTTGSNNTAVGVAALYSNTTASNNSAFGFNALLSNTTGSGNSAFGLTALTNSVSGSYNSSFGISNLFSLSTGYENSSLGKEGLRYTYDGYYNSSLGNLSLYSNTSGYQNTAVGHSAGYNVTTSATTIAINAGGSGYTNGTYNNVTLIINSGLGPLTAPLVNITVSGGAVTAVTVVSGGAAVKTTHILTATAASIGGTGSGFTCHASAVVTAINNTVIGYNAGASIVNNNNSVVIGASADIGQASGDNQLSIQNMIYGSGNSGTGTTASTGKIGIGQKNPGATLDILGSGSNTSFKIIGAGSSTNKSLDFYQNDGSTNILFLKDNGDFQVGLSSSKWGMFGASAVSQQSVLGILVNNVTSGGTTSTIANFTDLSTYSNDAATIRNNDYQLAKKILAIETALRNYGILKD